MSDKTQRDITVKFRATPEEYSLIKAKSELAGFENLSAYIRKMSIDGYVIKLELPELREVISLLRRSSANLNQIARRVNTTGRLYDADVQDIRQTQGQVWTALNGILSKLASL